MADGTDADARGAIFKTTRLDLIRLVRAEDRSEHARREAARALNELCHIYRAPVLAYLQRRTATTQDAEDLAQEFFARRICADLLLDTREHQGRFRALLLAALKNFLRDRNDHERAQKRGGGIKFVPLQEADACADTPASEDVFFDKCWAKTLVERALSRLRGHFAERGHAATYDVLVPFICDAAVRSELGAAASRLGISVNALQVRLSRFRASYATCIRSELARTVNDPREVEPETRYLLEVLAASR